MVFQEINKTIDTLKNLTISNERKLELQPLIDFIQKKTSEHKNVNLNFICKYM